MACYLVAPSHCLNPCWLIIINLVLFLKVYKYIGIRILGFRGSYCETCKLTLCDLWMTCFMKMDQFRFKWWLVGCWCQTIAWTRVDLTSCNQVHWIEFWKLICQGVILQYMSVLAPTDPLLPGRVFNSASPGLNGRHFRDDIFICILWMKSFVFWFEFHWCLFPRIQLTINQHWFR